MMHIINTFIFRDKSIEFKGTSDSRANITTYLLPTSLYLHNGASHPTCHKYTVLCIWAVITINILKDKNIFLHIIIIEQH